MENKKIISEYFSKLGKKSSNKLTKQQRIDRAKNAIFTRWKKRDIIKQCQNIKVEDQQN